MSKSQPLIAKTAKKTGRRASFFGLDRPIRYEGPQSRNPLAFRWYDPDKKVFGKRLEDHLRMAVCYWHTFCWGGGDPFGGSTLIRPWFDTGDPMGEAKLKADVAFEMYEALGVPFFTFHDRDIAPEGATLKESNKNVRIIADIFAAKMEKAKARLLWGTANLFSNRRYMAGAATNPDPEVFAYAAAQVKNAIDVTHLLGGANYVLWGGREGYETLLNTDIGQELDQLGRFMNMVVDYKHKIGFTGTILIEPKPQEPTKHQYDYDVATVYGFLKTYGLEKHFKFNIETNHATLAGHTFQHEIETAAAHGLLGSVDANTGDTLLGWDTDQFNVDIRDITLALLAILRAGGLGRGGFNFDAKLRRPSIDPEDLFYAHIGGMDAIALGYKTARRILADGALEDFVAARYASYDSGFGRDIERGKVGFPELQKLVLTKLGEPEPRSGRQEYLENLLSRLIDGP